MVRLIIFHGSIMERQGWIGMKSLFGIAVAVMVVVLKKLVYKKYF